MPIAGSLFIILLFSFFAGRLARNFHLSEVIGLILVSVFLTSPFMDQFIVIGHEIHLRMLANAGLLALMFISGLEVSGNMLFKEEKDSLVITFFTMLISLILGTTVMLLLGFEGHTALVMGICFGITAEATKGRVLLQLKKNKTKIGAVLMGTGIINDAIGILMFVAVVYFSTHHISFSEIKILGAVIMAFILGIVVHYNFNRFTSKVKIFENFLLLAVVPFFFLDMGLAFNASYKFIDIKILLIVIITAAAGQLLGVFITKPITKFSLKQLWLLGWGMNSKGAVELAIAYIALHLGILPIGLYSSIVVVTIVSTLTFQVVIFRMVEKDPSIMD